MEQTQYDELLAQLKSLTAAFEALDMPSPATDAFTQAEADTIIADLKELVDKVQTRVNA